MKGERIICSVLSKYFMKKVTKAVIPAAGLGTRVLPATKALPKEMLTIEEIKIQ